MIVVVMVMLLSFYGINGAYEEHNCVGGYWLAS